MQVSVYKMRIISQNEAKESKYGAAFLFYMVPVVGVEPTRSCPHRILSPARLPIPPHRHDQKSEYSNQKNKKTTDTATFSACE